MEHGAPEDIRYSHKPHIGTDLLRQVVKSIRMELLALGCEVRFGHRLAEVHAEGGRVSSLTVEGPEGPYALPCEALLLAPGHSARDTFAMLHTLGVPLEQKSFAIGVRVEHLQAALSEAQYGPAWTKLPPSDYKLSCHLPGGRSVFSFCVCPGGQVVAAASGPGQVVTNGMSLRARDGENINGGLLVGVGPEDFPGGDPLAGVRFQETWERAAWELGAAAGPFHAPGPSGPPTAPEWPGPVWRAACPPMWPGASGRPSPCWTGRSGASPVPRPSSPGWRPAPPPRCASSGTRRASRPSVASSPAGRGRATPAASCRPPPTASAQPSGRPRSFPLQRYNFVPILEKYPC